MIFFSFVFSNDKENVFFYFWLSGPPEPYTHPDSGQVGSGQDTAGSMFGRKHTQKKTLAKEPTERQPNTTSIL